MSLCIRAALPYDRISRVRGGSNEIVLGTLRIRLIPQDVSRQPGAVGLLGSNEFFRQRFTELSAKRIEGLGRLDLRSDMVE
jgi:hypothetical protein